MSTLSEPRADERPVVQSERLRMASFGALTMLLLQFVLGTAYNLAPTASKSVGMFSNPLLATHVIFGILIILAAAVLALRAVRAKISPVTATSVVGLLAVLGAFGAGFTFIRGEDNWASFGMALAAAIAMGCYAANLVILGKPRG
jgi:hypothetical protein